MTNQTKSVRRTKIGQRKLTPTDDDIAEYLIYRLYQVIKSRFNKSRKGASADFCEIFGYLFMPWACSKVALTHESTVRLVWKQARAESSVKSMRSLKKSITVTSTFDDIEDRNDLLVQELMESSPELILVARHKVMVRMETTGDEVRAHDGTCSKDIRRLCSVLDAVSWFLASWCGFDRAVGPAQLMIYHKRTLQVMYGMAVVIRDAMDCSSCRPVQVPRGTSTRSGANLSSAEKNVLHNISELLTPARSLQKRSLEKAVCSVLLSYYKRQHVPVARASSHMDSHRTSAQSRHPHAREYGGTENGSASRGRGGPESGSVRGPSRPVHGSEHGPRRQENGSAPVVVRGRADSSAQQCLEHGSPSRRHQAPDPAGDGLRAEQGSQSRRGHAREDVRERRGSHGGQRHAKNGPPEQGGPDSGSQSGGREEQSIATPLRAPPVSRNPSLLGDERGPARDRSPSSSGDADGLSDRQPRKGAGSRLSSNTPPRGGREDSEGRDSEDHAECSPKNGPVRRAENRNEREFQTGAEGRAGQRRPGELYANEEGDGLVDLSQQSDLPASLQGQSRRSEEHRRKRNMSCTQPSRDDGNRTAQSGGEDEDHDQDVDPAELARQKVAALDLDLGDF